jgi:hypothetical protein
MLVVEILEATVSKVFFQTNCETLSTFCFDGNHAVLLEAFCIILHSSHPLNSNFCCTFQVSSCVSTVLSLKYHDMALFESRENFLPNFEMKIVPSIASNSGHHAVTLLGHSFELLPIILIANIPASWFLASNVICKIPRSMFVGQTHVSISPLNLSLPFVYTSTLIVESYKI